MWGLTSGGGRSFVSIQSSHRKGTSKMYEDGWWHEVVAQRAVLRMSRMRKMTLELIPKEFCLFLFFFNGFVVIQLTYHKLHPFKAYNLLVSSAFTESCDHHHGIILEDSPHLRTTSPLAITPPRSLTALPEAQATVLLLWVSIGLPIWDILKGF